MLIAALQSANARFVSPIRNNSPARWTARGRQAGGTPQMRQGVCA
jgi:hypothetical protein